VVGSQLIKRKRGQPLVDRWEGFRNWISWHNCLTSRETLYLSHFDWALRIDVFNLWARAKQRWSVIYIFPLEWALLNVVIYQIRFGVFIIWVLRVHRVEVDGGGILGAPLLPSGTARYSYVLLALDSALVEGLTSNRAILRNNDYILSSHSHHGHVVLCWIKDDIEVFVRLRVLPVDWDPNLAASDLAFKRVFSATWIGWWFLDRGSCCNCYSAGQRNRLVVNDWHMAMPCSKSSVSGISLRRPTLFLINDEIVLLPLLMMRIHLRRLLEG